MTTDALTPDQPLFWESRYAKASTPWDLNSPAPAFISILEKKHPFAVQAGKMAVVGCGLGHDAALFGAHGFDVTGLDFSPLAIEGARERYGDLARFTVANLFELSSEMRSKFDWVLEHACFCAIPPKQRRDYVKQMAQLLTPNGHLLGIFWTHDEWGGPPYKTDVSELTALFSPLFDCVFLEKTDLSPSGRENEELLGLFKKKTV